MYAVSEEFLNAFLALKFKDYLHNTNIFVYKNGTDHHEPVPFLQVRQNILSAVCPLQLHQKPRITQNGKNCKAAQTCMNKGFTASERKKRKMMFDFRKISVKVIFQFIMKSSDN